MASSKKRTFLIALKFEAHIEVDAEDEIDAQDIGLRILKKHHVYSDEKVQEMIEGAHQRGAGGLAFPFSKINPVFLQSNPDFIKDDNVQILEEIK
jgi:hypothetical protein